MITCEDRVILQGAMFFKSLSPKGADLEEIIRNQYRAVTEEK
jgi:hypothetical protein